jgi:hypothetical protein
MSQSALQSLAHDAAMAPTDPDRAAQLVQAFQSLPADEREAALQATATSLAADNPSCRLLRELAGSTQQPTRLLALELAARLPAAPSLTPPWRLLLADQSLPLGLQFAAVVTQVPRSGTGAVELLYSFVRGLDRDDALERLQSLQARLGKIPAIQEARLCLGIPLGPRCPRCGAEFDEAAMPDHLWNAHRLVVRDELVCDPWVQIEDAVALAGDDPDRLATCFEQAMTVDGENGLTRLELLLAKYGLESPSKPTDDSKPTLLSTCPRCGATVPCPATPPARTLNVAGGRLSLGGYRVEITETGFRSQLEVTTPDALIHRGPEPGRFLTPRAAMLLFAGLPVLLALLVATRVPDPRLGVALCLLLAAAGYGLALYSWKLQQPALDRAVNHAWKFFAARTNLADAEFLDALAEVSCKQGQPAERERSVERIIAQLEPNLRTSGSLLDRLVPLWRLAIEDSARLGRDPTVAIARLIFRSLQGQLPLSAADRLLAGWDSADRARLRSRLWEQAFESGLTVGQLREAGRLAPALGQLIGEKPVLNDPDRLSEMQKETPDDIVRWKERLTLTDVRRCAACGERFLARPGEKGIAL